MSMGFLKMEESPEDREEAEIRGERNDLTD